MGNRSLTALAAVVFLFALAAGAAAGAASGAADRSATTLDAVAGATATIPLPAHPADGTVRITKIAPLAPTAVLTAYLPTGVVFEGPAPASGDPLQFLFWDAGTYTVDLVDTGGAVSGPTVRVRPAPHKVLVTAATALVVGLLGMLAGYTSRRLPRPGAAAVALLAAALLLTSGVTKATAGSFSAEVPVAGQLATVTIPSPGGSPAQPWSLQLEHIEDDLTLLTTAWTPGSHFAYRFPEGGEYRLRLTLAGGAEPITHTLVAAPVLPTSRTLVRGWLQWVGVFLTGGAAGFWLTRRRGRDHRRTE